MQQIRSVLSLLLILTVLSKKIDTEKGPQKLEGSRPKSLPKWNNKSELTEILLKGYDKFESPVIGVAKKGTKVSVGAYIISFDYIDERSMDYKISMYLRQTWMDPRLRYRSKSGNASMNIRLPIHDRIWLPDVYFRNERSAQIHSVTASNKLLLLRSDGRVWYVIRISVELFCPMYLQKYPFDTQFCPIYFESFSHTSKQMSLRWISDNPIQAEDHLRVPNFQLVGWKLGKCAQKYITGVYDCQIVFFQLRRQYGTYVFQIFLPTAIFVALSWIGFWINPAAVPARCMICMLAAVALAVGITSAKVARVSYVMAVDIWYMTCLIYVLLAFVEYAIVDFTQTKVQRIKKKEQKRKRSEQTNRKALFRNLTLRVKSSLKQRKGHCSNDSLEYSSSEENDNLKSKQEPGINIETVNADTTRDSLDNSASTSGANTPVRDSFYKENGQLRLLTPINEEDNAGDYDSDEGSESEKEIAKNSCFCAPYMDLVSRIIFPVTFGIFVCMYFTLHITNLMDGDVLEKEW